MWGSKGVIELLLRIVLAAVLSVLVVPLGSNLAPSVMTALAPESAQLPQLPDSVIRLIERSASEYGVPQPSVRFVDSLVPGFTQKSPNREASEILLGRPLQKPIFLSDNAVLLQAIVGHEFGHAVMYARGESFPAWVILAMYGAGLISLLVIQPTKRGAVLIFGVCVAFIAGWSTLSPTATLHSIYLELLHSLCFLSVLGGVLVRYGQVKVPKMPAGISMPSTQAWITAAVLSVLLYYSVGFWVGQANTDNELQCDLVGACLTSPTAMRDALLELRVGKPVSGLQEWADFFHPHMRARIQRLEALQGLQFEAMCASLRDPTQN